MREIGFCDGEGIGPHSAKGGGFGLVEGCEIPEAPKAAGIAETDIGAGSEGDDDVGVEGDGGICWEAINAAGHAEVDEEGLVIVGDAEKFFAVAEGGCDFVSDEAVEWSVGWCEEIGAGDVYGADADAEEVGLEGAADFFDFG